MKRIIFRLLPLTGVAALLLLAAGTVMAADVVPPVIDLPGTQPQEVGNFESPGRCDNCHAGYDPASVWSNEPSFGWAGGAMGNAGRDPIFWATLAVAEQDFDGSGDLCIRCHSAGGWIAGRSTPTDGSGLAAGDDDGVDCDTCHLATNPDNSEHLGVMNEPFVANDPVDGEGYYGSGMFSAWGGADKLGPYNDAEARHRFMQSQFHRGDICGTCHDVSNSAVGHYAPNHGAQPLAVGNVVTDGPRVHPDPDHLLGTQQAYVALNNPPYAYGIVERTFSEYKAGLVSQTLVTDYTNLPADLRIQGGALDFAYNAAMLAGGTYEDGTPRYFNCQGCHMRPDVGKGCDKNGAPIRTDLPKHDQSGGNYWMWPLIQYQDQQGTLRMGGGLTQFQLDAMDAGRQRAEQQLQMAANLEVIGDTVRITNLTGHKLITGYPEGRRMWLNIKWYNNAQTLLREDGAYGPLPVAPGTFLNPADGTEFVPQSILDLSGANTRIYEVHPGMSQDWAGVLMSVAPAIYETIPIGYDRLTGASTGTIGDLSAGTLGSYEKSFHFVLNNIIIDDNRIPPYGMDYETARVRNALPVPDTQYGGGPTYNYWDEVPLSVPAGATYADITLFYQGTSWEYVQFLWLANNEQNAFLGQEGVNFLDAWINADPAAPMVPPFVMATASWGSSACTSTEPTEATCDDGVDNDCDGLVDAADPDCAGCTPTASDDVTCDGIDDDCNGLIDDGFVTGPTNCGLGECASTGELVCVDGSTVDTCTPGIPGVEGPFGDATCSDALDNDCDGEYDGADPDCQQTLDCTTIPDQGTCETYAECRWNKKKGCLNR